MGAFMLVILIMIGSGEDFKSFEIKLSKGSLSECLNDLETFQFPLPIISVEIRCEPVVGHNSETQDAGAST